MDVNPRQALLLLRMGCVEELLQSEGIWLCASCQVCGTRCPRKIDYARIAEACRAIMLRRKQSRLDPDTARPDQLEEIPQQAFVAGYRKLAG
jgi:heterodisulfide reductase subunit C